MYWKGEIQPTSMFQSIIALLQFTTILPLGKTADFNCFAHRTWLYPVAGYLTGGVAALFIFLVHPPLMVGSALALALLLILTGCNHLDGLLDLGDGLMAHGSREKRVTALTDRQIGTGGIAAGLVVTLIAFASLASISQGAWAILLAEVGSKTGMALLTILGRPFRPGIHATLHQYSSRWFLIPALILFSPVLLLPLPIGAIGGSCAVILGTALSLLIIGERLFGGINGDIVGSGNEICRALILCVCASIQ
jgi:adenosylcobinamide-GDP ribazoletransferase